VTTGLRPPRVLLEDLREFTRWCKAQVLPTALSELVDDIGATSTTTTTTITEIADKLWTIFDIAADITAFVLQKSNEFVMVRSLASSAISITVPADQEFDIGTQISFYQKGAGQITLVADAGVTLNTPTTLKSESQYSTMTIIQEAGNEWMVAGRIAAT